MFANDESRNNNENNKHTCKSRKPLSGNKYSDIQCTGKNQEDNLEHVWTAVDKEQSFYTFSRVYLSSNDASVKLQWFELKEEITFTLLTESMMLSISWENRAFVLTNSIIVTTICKTSVTKMHEGPEYKSQAFSNTHANYHLTHKV